jgi:DNA-binding LacI/PurR family transcriptional regulator
MERNGQLVAGKKLLYRRIKEELLGRIAGMQPHDRIPPRNRLMEEFGVTRTTVDRAVSELVADGHLYARDGSGTYVAETYRSFRARPDATALTWAIIIPDVVHYTYSKISRAVEDFCHEADISLIVCNTDNFLEKQDAYIYRMIERRVDGVIVVPAIRGEDHVAPFRDLQKHGIPFVFCNRTVNGVEVPAVISNRFYGVYMATRHLVQLGRRRIGYISRPLNYSVMLDYQGFVTALEEADLPLLEDMIRTDVSYDEADPGYREAREALSVDPPPDALVCFNDTIARNAYRAVEEAGKTVGREVAVVGYGNAEFCEMLPVPLTSVDFRSYDTGKLAADYLMKLVRKEKITPHPVAILKPQLVVRQSCGSPAGGAVKTAREERRAHAQLDSSRRGIPAGE